MKNCRSCLIAAVAVFCGLMLSPGITRADDLTGTTGISWLYGGTTIASDTIAVGSTLTCSSTSETSPICAGYSDGFTVLGTETFSVSNSPDPSITYSVSDYPGIGNPPYPGTTDGFEFTDLNFGSGDPLGGFTIVDNTIGLTDTDITITGSSIFINLAGLPVDGTFTIDLTPQAGVPTPEPSSLLMLGIGLLALMGLAGKRLVSDRFALQPAR